MVQGTQESPQEKKKARLKTVLIVAGILLIIILAIIFIISFGKPKTDDLDVVELGTVSDIEETLNSDYAQAVSGTPHADYKTDLNDTKFSTYSVSLVCEHLGTSCKELASPVELANFKHIETLNANALDYYLDNGHIVIMMAVYSYSDSATPYPYVIYARTNGQYYVFDPDSRFMVYMAKSELLDSIIGVPEFYISERSANGD